MKNVSFRGRSGQVYNFALQPDLKQGFGRAGIVLIAKSDHFSLRVVQLISLQPSVSIWQLSFVLSAVRRYGDIDLYFLEQGDSQQRSRILADLEAGFDPLCKSVREPMALAA